MSSELGGSWRVLREDLRPLENTRARERRVGSSQDQLYSVPGISDQPQTLGAKGYLPSERTSEQECGGSEKVEVS